MLPGALLRLACAVTTLTLVGVTVVPLNVRSLLKVAYEVASAAVGVAVLFWSTLVPRRGVPVLGYHSIGRSGCKIALPPADLERQLRFLTRSGHHVLSPSQLVDRLCGGRPLPDRAVVLTFDDGFEDNYETALPVLEQCGLKAGFFVTVDYVGHHYVWDSQEDMPPLAMMNWGQLAALRSAGHDVGSHTLSHCHLTAATPEKRWRELAESRRVLEERLGGTVNLLCYPYGDYEPSIRPEVVRSGYRAAFSTEPGTVRQGDDPFTLKRYMIDRISGRDPFTAFVLFLTCLCGTFEWYDRLSPPGLRRWWRARNGVRAGASRRQRRTC